MVFSLPFLFWSMPPNPAVKRDAFGLPASVAPYLYVIHQCIL